MSSMIVAKMDSDRVSNIRIRFFIRFQLYTFVSMPIRTIKTTIRPSLLVNHKPVLFEIAQYYHYELEFGNNN